MIFYSKIDLCAICRSRRPSLASGRPSRSRLLTRAVVDQTSLDISAAITALATSAALGMSLAKLIRQANGFDIRDKAFAAEYLSKTSAAPEIVMKTPEPETPVPAPAMIVEAPEPVVAAISNTEPEPTPEPIPEPVAAAVSVPEPEVAPKASPVAAAVAAMAKILPGGQKEPSTPVVLAATAVAEPEPEHASEVVISLASEVAEMPATTKVTEPTVRHSESNPVVKVLEAVSYNFTNGAFNPATTSVNEPEPLVQEEEPAVVESVLVAAVIEPEPEPEPILVADVAADTAAQTAAAAKEYDSRLAKVLAESKLDATSNGNGIAAVHKRAVTISEQYQEKIKSLWSGYEKRKDQEAVLLSKKEAISLEFDEIEAVQQAQQETAAAAAASTNPVQALISKFLAMIGAIWAFFVALFEKLGGGSDGAAGAGAPA